MLFFGILQKVGKGVNPKRLVKQILIFAKSQPKLVLKINIHLKIQKSRSPQSSTRTEKPVVWTPTSFIAKTSGQKVWSISELRVALLYFMQGEVTKL